MYQCFILGFHHVHPYRHESQSNGVRPNVRKRRRANVRVGSIRQIYLPSRTRRRDFKRLTLLKTHADPSQARDWFANKNVLQVQPIAGSSEFPGYQPFFSEPSCYHGGTCGIHGFPDQYLIGV